MATHEFDGNPCNIGTKNCKHPLQWPINSIIQIKLNIRINTDAIFKNCRAFIHLDGVGCWWAAASIQRFNKSIGAKQDRKAKKTNTKNGMGNGNGREKNKWKTF